ncbi:MAG: hypothetical protein IKJ98_07145 [Bacteroidales bacterium]|nr:hypothetical protein [Bacteroidales bacterium]
MKQRLFLILLLFLGLAQLATAQENFFTDDSQDTLAKNFYQRNKRMTILPIVNVPSFQTGAVVMIHNNENRVSYYFEAKTNFSRYYVISGVECYGEGTREKKVSFTSTIFNVGVARGFTRNWFVYGAVGTVVKQTHFDNEVEDNYRYTVPNNGIWFNLAVGGMYVTDKNFSMLAGFDLYDRSVTLGIGYTF